MKLATLSSPAKEAPLISRLYSGSRKPARLGGIKSRERKVPLSLLFSPSSSSSSFSLRADNGGPISAAAFSIDFAVVSRRSD